MLEVILTNPSTPQWLLAIVVVAAIVYEGMRRRGDWKKASAEAASTDADADVKVSGAWREFADRLERENDDLRKRIAALEKQGKERDEQSRRNRERIQELDATTTRLENERVAWQAERREWRMGVSIIIEQMRRLEIEPKWKPPDTGPYGQKPKE